MDNSFRFYRNTDCCYFPCHEVENDEDFNCMFCYCPLFLLEDCKGNPTYKNGIKDCSNCLVPHRPRGYDHINEMLLQEVFYKQQLERFEKEKEDKKTE